MPALTETAEKEQRPRILHVAGARPNFMKVAPVMAALRETGAVAQTLVHTGQHYDQRLSETFFDDLGLPRPDVNLQVGSDGQAAQIGRMISRLGEVLREFSPEWVFVVGDVNSTLAAALTAARSRIPVAHVEAGLRSGDRSMPEESNRLVTDHLSRALFVTERSARENLKDEGVSPERIHCVGNVMIDTLDRMRSRAADCGAHERLGVPEKSVLVTVHRPQNVDDRDRLGTLLRSFREVQRRCGLPVVLPIHPRTEDRVESFGLGGLLDDLHVLEPLGYLDFLCLMGSASVVITDSGGIQEETTVLGIPCVTVRRNTERPVTLDEGTNVLFYEPLDDLPSVVEERLRSDMAARRPPLWDGSAADRIAQITVDTLLGLPG